MIAIFGGGDIAERGIVPVVPDCKVIGQGLLDVREYRDVEQAIRAPRPSAVVFTAGVSRPKSVTSSNPEAWRAELETNLLGAYHVAKAAVYFQVPTLIFIASIAGLYGKPNHSGYCASKSGLISLVQSLAMEGHNAYAISPGRVDTKMRERDYPGEDPRTRLSPLAIGEIVADMLAGKYSPGDNVVIRMRGHEVLPLEVHRGDGWRERLKVGEPPTC